MRAAAVLAIAPTVLQASMIQRKRVAFIGNSLPRRCGIATFTTDPHKAIQVSSLQVAPRLAGRLPTSQKLQVIFESAAFPSVTLEWLLRSLGERSFGLMMLLLGLLAMLPGVCVLGGFGLAILGLQMAMAKEEPVLPTFVARQPLPVDKVLAVIGRIIPAIKILEKFIQPRWHTPFIVTKRIVGLVIVLLAITIFVPIPLSNILPGALAILVALAYLEQDGILLGVVLTASIASLLITGMEVWGTAEGAELLLRF